MNGKLPDIDGFRICQKIREQHFYPIIMLTKPFNPLEVVARVKTQLRRYVHYNHGSNSGEDAAALAEYDIRGLVINKSTHKCTLYGKEIALTPMEFSILWYLCGHRGNVISSGELFESYYSRCLAPCCKASGQ